MRVPFMGHDCGLNHCQEDEFIVVFAFHNTTNKSHPNRGLRILVYISCNVCNGWDRNKNSHPLAARRDLEYVQTWHQDPPEQYGT